MKINITKKILVLLASGVVFLAGTFTGRAAVFFIDISPLPGTALNLGPAPTHYFVDHAVGLAALNESAPVPPSPATGNEIGAGITFDSVTKMLSFHVGYGPAFGFAPLVGPYADAHLHGPGPVVLGPPGSNASGPPIAFLGGFHIPAGPGTGFFFGSVPLGLVEEGMLFENKIYLNIHSATFPGGEIRGQLVPVIPEPATAALFALGGFALAVRRRR